MLYSLIQGFEHWSELDLLTATILGEAEGEPWGGKAGVAITIKTRVDHPRWWGRNWREVILRATHDGIAQFECWTKPHRIERMELGRERGCDDKIWEQCRQIAIFCYLGKIQDRLGCPTHYCRIDAKPAWKEKLKFLGQIGHHLFYSEI